MLLETVSSIAIIAIALLFLNPGHLSMPNTTETMLILAIIVAFIIFSGLILKEKSKDERESIHILTAGRLSYLVGIGTLIVGTIVQALSHNVDKWLIFALCAMILSKLISRIYSNFKM